MKILNYPVELPEPKKENARAIIKMAQNLHRNRRTHKKWNDYWIEAYQKVLEILE